MTKWNQTMLILWSDVQTSKLQPITISHCHHCSDCLTHKKRGFFFSGFEAGFSAFHLTYDTQLFQLWVNGNLIKEKDKFYSHNHVTIATSRAPSRTSCPIMSTVIKTSHVGTLGIKVSIVLNVQISKVNL